MTQPLHNKYIIAKSDGTPVDSSAKYIVLRYDAGSDDEIARSTLLHYCNLMGDTGSSSFRDQLWADIVAESRKYAALKHGAKSSDS